MTLPDGWLTDGEADELRRLAHGARVLELGAWKGRSTVALAQVAALVVSVDRHRPFTHFGVDVPDDTLDVYLAAVRPFENVVPVIGEFSVVEMFSPDAFDLVLVDGVHDYDSVHADLLLAMRFEATLAMHDWGRFDVAAAAGALGIVPAKRVDSLAILF